MYFPAARLSLPIVHFRQVTGGHRRRCAFSCPGSQNRFLPKILPQNGHFSKIDTGRSHPFGTKFFYIIGILFLENFIAAIDIGTPAVAIPPPALAVIFQAASACA
jgi:hypothetical protein